MRGLLKEQSIHRRFLPLFILFRQLVFPSVRLGLTEFESSTSSVNLGVIFPGRQSCVHVPNSYRN